MVRSTEELREDALVILNKKIEKITEKLLDTIIADRKINGLPIPKLATDMVKDLIDNAKIINSEITKRENIRNIFTSSHHYLESEHNKNLYNFVNLLDLRDAYKTEDPKILLQKILENS